MRLLTFAGFSVLMFRVWRLSLWSKVQKFVSRLAGFRALSSMSTVEGLLLGLEGLGFCLQTRALCWDEMFGILTPGLTP